MFENDGSGVFNDITETAGLGYVGHSSGGIFFDYNLDGLLDLFLTNVGVYTILLIVRLIPAYGFGFVRLSVQP